MTAILPRTVAIVSLTILITTASPRADAPGAVPSAGLEAELAGDFARALRVYEAVPPFDRTVRLRLHMATCKARVGRVRDAISDFQDLVNDPFVRPEALAGLADAKGRLGRIYVEVVGVHDDITVFVDGEKALFDEDHPVDPGTHVVVMRKGAKEVARKRCEVEAGKRVEAILFAPVPPAATSPTPTITVVGNGAQGPVIGATGPVSISNSTTNVYQSSITPLLFTGAIAGGLAIGSFLFLRETQSDVIDNCRQQIAIGPCDLKAAGIGRLRAFEVTTWALGGISVASFGTALVLWRVDAARPSSKQGASVSVVASPFHFSLQGAF